MSKPTLNFTAAMLVLLLVLCSGTALLAWGLHDLGIDIASLPLPNIGTIGFYIIVLFIAAVSGQFFAFWIARVLRKPVYNYFDRRWLPTPGTGEQHVTLPGESLEAVVPPSIWKTTILQLATRTIPATIATSFALGVIAMIGARIVGFPSMLAGMATIMTINTVFLTWSFWEKEWVRKRTNFLAFTFAVWYVSARSSFLALFLWRETLVKASKTPIHLIQEPQIVSDPQDVDPRIKTPWLLDRYTGWLSRKKGVRTVFLRSIIEDAEDILVDVENGPGLLALITRLIPKGREIAAEQQFVSGEVFRSRMPDLSNPDWTPQEGAQKAARYLNMYRQMSPNIVEGGKVYDVYRQEAFWPFDSQGNPISTQASPNTAGSAVNIAGYFRTTIPPAVQPPTAESLVEPPNESLDQLPH